MADGSALPPQAWASRSSSSRCTSASFTTSSSPGRCTTSSRPSPWTCRGSTVTTRGTAPAAARGGKTSPPGVHRAASRVRPAQPPVLLPGPCAQKTPSSLAKQTGPTGAPTIAFPLSLQTSISSCPSPPRPPHPGAFPVPSCPPRSTPRGLHDLRVHGSPQVHSSLGPLTTGSCPPPLVPIWVTEARRAVDAPLGA